MFCLLHGNDGWFAGSIEAATIDQKMADDWCDGVCTTLGLPLGTLKPVLSETDTRDTIGYQEDVPVEEVQVGVSAGVMVPSVPPLTGDEITKLRALIGE